MSKRCSPDPGREASRWSSRGQLLLPVVADRLSCLRQEVRLTLPLVPSKLPEANQRPSRKPALLLHISNLVQRNAWSGLPCVRSP